MMHADISLTPPLEYYDAQVLMKFEANYLSMLLFCVQKLSTWNSHSHQLSPETIWVHGYTTGLARLAIGRGLVLVDGVSSTASHNKVTNKYETKILGANVKTSKEKYGCW